MDENCFIFLKDDFPDIYKYCKKAEISFVKQEYKDSLNNSGKALEGLIFEISERENLGYEFNNKDLIGKINDLDKYHLLNGVEARFLHNLRKSRNSGSHYDDSKLVNPQKDALNAHQTLFNFSARFYKKYGDKNFKIPKYTGTIYTYDIAEDVVEQLKPYIDEQFENINSNNQNDEIIDKLKPLIDDKLANSNNQDEIVKDIKDYIDEAIKNSSGDVYNITNSFNTNDTSNIDIKKTNAHLSNTEVNNNLDLNQKQINNTNVGIETNNTVNDTKVDINQTKNDIKKENTLNLEDNRKNINNHKKSDSKGSNKLKYALVVIIALIIVVAGAYLLGAFDSISSDSSSSDVDLSNPYWASISSGKFHKSNCEWANKIPSGNLKTYPDRESAIADGMIPCHDCNP